MKWDYWIDTISNVGSEHEHRDSWAELGKADWEAVVAWPNGCGRISILFKRPKSNKHCDRYQRLIESHTCNAVRQVTKTGRSLLLVTAREHS